MAQDVFSSVSNSTDAEGKDVVDLHGLLSGARAPALLGNQGNTKETE
jgi:hypothetical protein